ncbi:MAG: TonB-dependent receptor plug domain-containing protein, partial [Bacteroidota bacterium]
MKRTNQIGLGHLLAYVCLMLTLMGPSLIRAQGSVQVSGQVSNEAGESLEGVTVIEKGTPNGDITDAEGRYSFNVSSLESATLIFSYYGYEKTEVALEGRSQLNLTMEVSISSLDEVVVVGYGSVDKKDLTGSVASLKAEDFIQGTVISPEDLLNGKVAGVQITTADGSPGGGSRVLVRGSTSILGNNQPLYIVDGIPIGNGGLSQNGVTEQRITTNPLSWLNPNDIASIDVLKGPSAQAIYGTRAAAGVVIITTKSGAAGQTVVEADIRVGVN